MPWGNYLVEALSHNITGDILRQRPANVAGPPFHLQHLSGALHRVFSYARGESFTQSLLQQLQEEDLPTAKN